MENFNREIEYISLSKDDFIKNYSDVFDDVLLIKKSKGSHSLIFIKDLPLVFKIGRDDTPEGYKYPFVIYKFDSNKNEFTEIFKSDVTEYRFDEVVNALANIFRYVKGNENNVEIKNEADIIANVLYKKKYLNIDWSDPSASEMKNIFSSFIGCDNCGKFIGKKYIAGIYNNKFYIFKDNDTDVSKVLKGINVDIDGVHLFESISSLLNFFKKMIVENKVNSDFILEIFAYA